MALTFAFSNLVILCRCWAGKSKIYIYREKRNARAELLFC